MILIVSKESKFVAWEKDMKAMEAATDKGALRLNDGDLVAEVEIRRQWTVGMKATLTEKT